MISLSRFFPWLVLAAGTFHLVNVMVPPSGPPGRMQLHELAKIPVVDRGRVKPIDTVARTSLLLVSNRQTFGDESGVKQPAVRWLLDVMTSQLSRKGDAEAYKVFKIENDQLVKMLGLEIRPEFWRYSLTELGPKFEQLEQEYRRAEQVDPKRQDAFDAKVIELYEHLQLYVQLTRLQTPLVVPPLPGEEEWQGLMHAVMDARRNGQENEAARAFGTILMAYAEGNAESFNREVAAYRQQLANRLPAETRLGEFEVFFNDFEPFYHCALLYVGVVILACLGWIGWPLPLNRAAFWLAVLTLGVHTWALGARMYMQGRPPVTNLYSAAVFVGWGCIVLALILEAIFHNGIGNVVAGVTGALTLVIAHHLAEQTGDTMEMMRAVLDTNFWLATHVTMITTGYAATLVAGFLGMIYILRGVFTPSLDREATRTLGQMIYGVLCFATFLSFTGTVLGGIWADQSWGRFWGWDPKENGALIIVLWNVLILHARWGGIIKQRGMAVLSLLGNMVTGWSFFGTNQLGVGLHSYGFSKQLAFWLVCFWASQVILIAVGLLPLRYWRSFAAQKQ